MRRSRNQSGLAESHAQSLEDLARGDCRERFLDGLCPIGPREPYSTPSVPAFRRRERHIGRHLARTTNRGTRRSARRCPLASAHLLARTWLSDNCILFRICRYNAADPPRFHRSGVSLEQPGGGLRVGRPPAAPKVGRYVHLWRPRQLGAGRISGGRGKPYGFRAPSGTLGMPTSCAGGVDCSDAEVGALSRSPLHGRRTKAVVGGALRLRDLIALFLIPAAVAIPPPARR
jgi:hypothetical protein